MKPSVVKQSSQAHENLTQVLEQVENGYPQICNHQKNCNKNLYSIKSFD